MKQFALPMVSRTSVPKITTALIITHHLSSGPAVSINAANAAIGYDFALNCTVLGLNVTTYEWSKDGISLNETGPTLFFSPLRLCDAGQYSCTVNSTNSDDIEVVLESMDVANCIIPNG